MKKVRWLVLLFLSIALTVTAVACFGKTVVKMTDTSGNEVEINYNDIDTISVVNDTEVETVGFELNSFSWSDITIHITFKDESTPAADVALSESMILAESKLKVGRPGTYEIKGIFAGKTEFSFTLKLYVVTEKTYQVVFYDESGERAIGSVQYYKEGSVAQRPTMPTKEGYTHIGWTKRGENALVSDFTVRGDVDYVAVYQSNYCAVRYYYSIGEKNVLIATASVPRGGNALDYAPEIPIVAGCSNGRWENSDAMRSVSADTDFYAVYESDTVLVTFSYYKYVEGTYYDYNVSGAMALGTEGVTPPADVEKIDDNVFLYWYIERNGKEQRVSFPYKVIGEIRFIAKYVSFEEGTDDLAYRYDDASQSYVVTGMKIGATVDTIVIPETHLGMPVRSVVDGAFADYPVKKFVVSSDNRYFRVYDGALYNATMTDLIAYPIAAERTTYQTVDSLTVVHPYAFKGASKLVSLVLGDKVNEVGEYAFADCTALRSFVLPDGVKIVPEGMLRHASSLTTFGMAADVTTIGDEAFYANASLREMQIPYGLQTLGADAFFGCNELTTVTMSSPVATVSRYFTVNNGALYGYNNERTNEYYYLYLFPSKFSGAGRSTEYTVHSGVRVVKSGAFVNSAIVGIYVPSTSVTFETKSVVCPLLKSIRFIANSSIVFEDDAFGGNLPDCLYVFSSTTIYNDHGVEKVVRTEAFSPYGEFSNDFAYELRTIDSKTRAYVTAYRGTAENVVIPNVLGAGEVTEIRDGVFAGNISVKSVTFPDSLRRVGDGAFEGCANLRSVYFGKDLKELGENAFAGCADGIRFYYEETKLSDVGRDAFGPIDEAYYVDQNGIVSVAGVVLKLLGYRKDVVIPQGTTIIAHEAFKKTNYISSVSFERASQTLRAIKESAFEGCEELVSVSFPTVTTGDGQRLLSEVGANAFADCIRLTSIGNRPSIGVDATAFARVGTETGACWDSDGSVLLSYNGRSEMIVVPAEYTVIDSYAFANNVRAKKIVLGDAITEIRAYAFAFCEALEEVEIGKDLAKIGEKAFYSCGSLRSFVLDEQAPVFHIAYDAFDGTKWLNEYVDDSVIINGVYFRYLGAAEELHILNSVTKINDRAFYYEADLDTVKFPDSLQVIGKDAFAYSSVSKFDFGQNASKISTIEDRAFYGCDRLQYLDVRAMTGLVTIGEDAFRDVKAADGATLNLRFGASVAEIGVSAFENSDISTVIFVAGSKLQVIEERVFYGCAKLRSVSFEGKSLLREIKESAFENCTTLSTFTNVNGRLEIVGDSAFKGDGNLELFNVNEEYLRNVGKDAFNGNKFIENDDDTMVFIGTVLVKYNGKINDTVTIPAKTTVIGNAAFAGNVYIKNIVFESDNDGGYVLQEIQAGAFEGCLGLQSIAFPSSLTVIRERAFYGCAALTSVYLSSVERIGVKAFGNCTSLTSVSIPDTVTVFGEDDNVDAIYGGGVFTGCTSLTSIEAEAGGAYVSVDGVLFYARGDAAVLVAYPNAKVSGVYDVPSTVTNGTLVLPVRAIAMYAFAETREDALGAVNLCKTVSYLGRWAFSGIRASVDFSPEATIDKINEYAFAEYKGDQIVLPDSIRSIERNAFENVTEVTTLRIPKSVASVGAYAYSGTTMEIVWDVEALLTSVGDRAFMGYEGASLTIPDSVTTIGEYAFDGITAVLTIQAALTEIGDYAFYGYAGDSIVIPDTVTHIGEYAYAELTEVLNVQIPSGVTTIGAYAFRNVRSVSFAPGAVITQVGSYSFAGYGGQNISLPTSVTSIAGYAFYASGLTTISILGEVTYIGAYAFARTGLTSFVVPVGVTEIGEGAFGFCPALTNFAVVRGNGVRMLGRGVFENDTALAEVTLPFVGRTRESEMYVGYLFGANAYSQNARYVPASLTCVRVLGGQASVGEGYYSTIVANAFYGCNRLKSLIVSDEAVAVRQGALVGCSSLSEVELPYGGVLGKLFGADRYNDNVNYVPASLETVRFVGVTEIEPYAMYACMNVQNVTIPASLTKIGKSAFFNCSRLSTFSIGEGVAEIGENAFARCSSLTAFFVAKDNEKYVASDGVLYEKNDENDTAKLFAYPLKKSATSYVVALNVDGVDYEITEIGGYVFHSSELTTVEVPRTVKTIGEFAFYYSQITSLRISTSEIGQNAFRGCKGMKIVYIDDDALARQSADTKGIFENVTHVYVPVSTFGNMGSNAYISNNYTRLTIGNTDNGVPVVCDGLKYYVFYKEGATNVTVASLPVESVKGKVQVDGEDFSVGLRYPTGTNVVLTATPNSGYAFVGWFSASGLISSADEFVFTVGVSNVTLRAEYSYVGDQYETGEWIVGETKKIGENDAITVSTLTSSSRSGVMLLVEGHGVLPAELQEYASTITALRICDGITKISDSAFKGFTKLTSVSFAESLEEIGDEAFKNCSSLRNVTGGKGLAVIGESAFENCTALISLQENGALREVKDRAFAKTALSSFRIPKTLSLAAIGTDVFVEADGLTSFEVEKGHETLVSYNGVVYSYDINTRDSALAIFPTGKTGSYEVLDSFEHNSSAYRVVAIRENAFAGCTSLTEVVLPAMLTEIGGYAFRDCLAIVAFSENAVLQTIGSYAFADYGGYELTIPGSVKTIGEYAFYRCYRFTEIVLPESVTNVHASAFSDCYKLFHIRVEGNVPIASPAVAEGEVIGANGTFVNVLTTDESGIQTLETASHIYLVGAIGISTRLNLYDYTEIDEIYPYAFYRSKTVTYVSTPSGTKKVGEYAFSSCKKLAGISVSAGIETIAANAFAGSPITSATIPVTAITYVPQNYLSTLILFHDGTETVVPAFAYRNCATLMSVTLREGITEIEESAFAGCAILSSVSISDGVTTVGASAFEGCAALTGVTLPASVADVEDFVFRGCVSLEIVELPTDLVSLGTGVFENCTALAEVEIPSAITVLSDALFRGCTLLTSVELPEALEEIGAEAFRNCSALTHIVIGDAVRKVGAYAYAGDVSVESLSTGTALEEIGAYAFFECEGITMVALPSSVVSIGDKAFARTGTNTVSISADSITVGDDVFDECTVIMATVPTVMIDSVLGASLVSLGVAGGSRIESDLTGCVGLQSLDIAADVVYIQAGAFDGVPISQASVPAFAIPYISSAYLSDLTIVSGVSIAANAAKDCSSLRTVTMANTVRDIGAYAFSGCIALSVLNLSSALVSIGAYAFGDDGALENVDIPDTVTDLGEGVFVGCSSVTTVTIPEGLTVIPAKAFKGNTALSSVTVSASVEEIGEEAFDGCISLATVYNNSDLTFTMGSTEYGSIAEYATTIVQAAFVVLGDFRYKISENHYYLVEYVGTDAEAELPADASGEPYVLRMKTTPRKLIVPSGITIIGTQAFSGCMTLLEIAIGDDVTMIEENAFRNCKNLLKVTVGESMEYISQNAFYGCVKLQEVYNRSDMDIVAGSEDNGYVAYYATNVYTDESGSARLTYSGDYAWMGNKLVAYYGSGTAITLPTSPAGYSIGSYAFAYGDLVGVTIPDNVSLIGAHAFDGSTSLDTVTIGNGIVSIGEYAFNGCSALTTVYIGYGVEMIQSQAFAGCVALEEVIVDGGNGYFAVVDDVLYKYGEGIATTVVNYSGHALPLVVTIGETDYEVQG